MNFDLNQLLQGPVRDLVLNQVGKQFGLSNETGGNLLNKGLSMVLGGMTHKASSAEGAKGLFDLIKNFNVQGNPLDLLTGKESNSNAMLELGKNILPSLFGSRADAVTEHLAASTNTSPEAAKGILGMLLPTVFSFFKGKILSGLGLGAFTGLLGSQTKALASQFDSKSLSALGFAGGSFDGVLSNLNKVSSSLGGLGTAATAAAGAATAAASKMAPEAAKSSGLGKWLLGGAVVLAALFGIKSCNNNAETATAQPAPATQAAPAAPVAEEVKVSEGLGDIAWAKGENDFTVSGTVQNDGVKGSILDAFKGLAGNLPLVDKLVVDEKADKFSFTNFAGLADLAKEFDGVNGSFADKAFNLVGKVANADAKAALADKAKALLGNAFSVNTDGVSFDAPVAKIVDGLGNLAWAKGENDFTVSGTVQNDGVKGSILDAFKGLAGNLPLVDKLVVDEKADQFSFTNFAGLAALANEFGVNGSFADKAFNLAGVVASDDAKATLVEKAKGILGGLFSVNADNVSVQAAEKAEESAKPAETAPAAEAAPIADMSQAKLDLEIVFNTGSSTINPEYHNRLNAFAKFLIENNRQGEIAGYTDNVGNAEANQKLSEQRANAVRNYLVAQGVPADALTAKGYGQENPVADNNTAEGRNKNRRIEFNAR